MTGDCAVHGMLPRLLTILLWCLPSVYPCIPQPARRQIIPEPTTLPTTTTTTTRTTTTTIRTTTPAPRVERQKLPTNCADIQSAGNRSSGVYRIYRAGNCEPPELCLMNVLCDLSTNGGGWTVIQQRVDNNVNFYRGWEEYRIGFGDLASNFWIGNDYLAEITSSPNSTYELLIQMTSFGGSEIAARYSLFRVAPEQRNYALSLGALFQQGSTIDNLAPSRDQPFGTFDRDTDQQQNVICGVYWMSGWWFDSLCSFTGNLNLPYEPDKRASQVAGIVWQGVADNARMRRVAMKIRPVGLYPSSRSA